MSKNLRALLPDEFEYINTKYRFSLICEANVLSSDCCGEGSLDVSYIMVESVGYDRKVLQSVNKSFSLNTPIRRVTISKEAIDMWIDHFILEHTLIEVQNALSILIVTHQATTVEEVRAQLLRRTASIKNVY